MIKKKEFGCQASKENGAQWEYMAVVCDLDEILQLYEALGWKY